MIILLLDVISETRDFKQLRETKGRERERLTEID
jgi:hypothetical protein